MRGTSENDVRITVFVGTDVLSADLRTYIIRSIRRSLVAFETRIKRVRVWCGNATRSRRCTDKRCLIVVRIDGPKDVIVEKLGGSQISVFDRALYFSERAVRRKLKTDRILRM